MQFRGIKTWEIIAVLKELGGINENNVIKIDECIIKIINEHTEISFNLMLPVVEIEVEGKSEITIKNLLNELKLRLFKAGG